MSRAEKLTQNTLVSFLQVVFGALIALLTTRLSIKYLGIEGYGLLTALGASGLFAAMFTSGLNLAALRHMSYEIGLPKSGKLGETFSSTIAVYGILGIGLVFVGFVFKQPFLDNLTIPVVRREACSRVFDFVLLAMGSSCFFSPFYALRQAHQDLLAISVFRLLNQAFLLVALISLPLVSWDGLVWIAGVKFFGSTFWGIVVWILCALSYSNVRPAVSQVRYSEMWRILKYAKWSMLSMFMMQLRTQFAILVMNVVFGPAINAAYAISSSANSLMMRLNGGVFNSVLPAMTSTQAQGDNETVSRLVSIGCRYGSFCALPAVIPLLIDTELFLNLWLTEYPPQTPLFARILVLTTALSLTIGGYGLAVSAMDRLAENILITLPLQVIAFLAGLIGIYYFELPAWFLPGSALVAISIQCLVYPLYFGKDCGLELEQWLRQCLIPQLSVAFIGCAAVAAVTWIFSNDLVKLVLNLLISGILIPLAIWKIGVRQDEKKSLIALVEKRFGDLTMFKRLSSIFVFLR